MTAKSKLKTADNISLREEIDLVYQITDQQTLSMWAAECAKHVLPFAGSERNDLSPVERGFKSLELWQTGNISLHKLRQTSLEIHKLALNCSEETVKNAIRTAGHAVAVGHMREHAMVCADYAIKTIQSAFPRETDRITQERKWQLNVLKNFRDRFMN
jgi:hypothetical protein